MGDIFVFINRPATHIKLLQWEGDGFALYFKRLERGTFERPVGSYDNASMALTSEQLSLILQGISLQHQSFESLHQHLIFRTPMTQVRLVLKALSRAQGCSRQL